MRILFLNHNVTGTGTYQRAFHFGRELARRGHAVTLVTTSRAARVRAARRRDGELEVVEAPDLFAGGARNGWDPWNTFRRIRLLDGRSFDLIHAFDSRPVVIGPALAVRRATGAPLFMDWADWWGRGGTIEERSGWLVRNTFGPVETWFEEAFRTRAGGSTVISEALRARCIGLGNRPELVTRLPNGCEAPEGNGRGVPAGGAARPAARSALGVPAGSPLIVHLGTAHAGDTDVLFDAMRLVVRRLPSARLALVGYGGRVPDDLRANGSVMRTGFVTRGALDDWLRAADVCVIALRDNVANRGRWPGKINEYLTAGRATAMSRVGDAAEVLAASGAGWTCEPGGAALAAALLTALQDADARAAAEQRAREVAATTLAWRRLAERLEEFYAVVMRATPGTAGQTGMAGIAGTVTRDRRARARGAAGC